MENQNIETTANELATSQSTNVVLSSNQVDLASLIKAGLVDEKKARAFGVKILGDGEVKRVFKVILPCSESAKKKIEKAGGKVIIKSEVAAEDKKESKIISPKKSTSKNENSSELLKNKKKSSKSLKDE
jgi:hypothetical protein